MDNVFFKPCNHAKGGQASWSKDRKERTYFIIKQLVRLKSNISLPLKYFGMLLFFLTIPKPFKQYTLLKIHYPFRSPFSPSSRIYKPEAGGLEAELENDK